jgi:hypothetical protein
MNKTRSQEVDELPDRNIETRLEQFHKFVEEDSIPYYLSFKERQELKLRKELQRQRKNQEQSDKSVRENSPAFINENFKPKPEDITPWEILLDQVRTNNEERIPLSEDKVMILDTEGNQRVASIKLAGPKVGPTNTIFDPHGDTDEDTNPLGTESHRPHSNIWEGWNAHTPLIFSQDDYDKNLGIMGEEFADVTSEEGKKLMDYPGADEVDLGGTPEKTSPPSAVQKPTVPLGVQQTQNTQAVSQQSQQSDNSNMNMEQQLEQTKYPQQIQHLPQDPIEEYNWDKKRGGHGLNPGQRKEPYGVLDRYVDLSNGIFHMGTGTG